MRSCRGCYVTRRRIYTETDQICPTLTHTSPSRLCIKRYDTTVPFRMFRLLDTSHDEAHYSDSFVPPRRFLRYCSWYIEHAPLNDFQDYLFSYCPVTRCRCIVERRQKGTHSRACGRRSSSDKQNEIWHERSENGVSTFFSIAGDDRASGSSGTPSSDQPTINLTDRDIRS